MEFIDFSDPLFLVVVAVLLLLALLVTSDSFRLKRTQTAAEIERALYDKDVAAEDRSLLPQGTNVATRIELTKATGLHGAAADATIKIASAGTDNVIREGVAATDQRIREADAEVERHLRVLGGEDDLSIRAAKAKDKYERSKGGGIPKPGAGNPVPGAGGQAAPGGQQPAGAKGANGKAADRHRKPKPPDEAPGA